MQTNSDCIVSAAMILYGEWVDIGKVQIPFFQTPEDLLIEKEESELNSVWLGSLSEETQEFIKMITACPEDFYQNGKLIKHKFSAMCLREKNWNHHKVKKLMKEVVRTIRV